MLTVLSECVSEQLEICHTVLDLLGWIAHKRQKGMTVKLDFWVTCSAIHAWGSKENTEKSALDKSAP